MYCLYVNAHYTSMYTNENTEKKYCTLMVFDSQDIHVGETGYIGGKHNQFLENSMFTWNPEQPLFNGCFGDFQAFSM